MLKLSDHGVVFDDLTGEQGELPEAPWPFDRDHEGKLLQRSL